MSFRPLFFVVCVVCACVFIACNDATGPVNIAGTYNYTDFTPLPTSTGSATALFPGAGIPLDSVFDTIVLNPDNTYYEGGSVWGNGESTPRVVIQAAGYYSRSGSTITLIPGAGATVGGFQGVIEKGVLKFERYSWAWTFARK